MRMIAKAALLLLTAAGLYAQQAGGSPEPEAAPGVQPGAVKAPKAAAPILINPASPAARLMLATPDERERALASFPPERQTQIRRQLQWFDSLPRPQQQVQIRRLERFAKLPQAARLRIRQRIQDFNLLPPARKQALRRVLQNLESLAPRQRANRLNSKAFQDRFSPAERAILADLAALLPPM